jgi:hypothetical protein
MSGGSDTPKSGDLAPDVRQHLTSGCVDAEKPRSAGEPGLLQMAEQGMHQWSVVADRAADRAASPDYAFGDITAQQRNFGFGLVGLDVGGCAHHAPLDKTHPA